MLVRDLMTRDVTTAHPDKNVQWAAHAMSELDVGVLPVGEDDRLVGMITDRDIALRSISQGKGPATQVREIMSTDVKYCFADQDVDDVALNMADIQVRRRPVWTVTNALWESCRWATSPPATTPYRRRKP